MTLADLYDSIDWSETEEALSRWKTLAPQSSTDEPEESFTRNFRIQLLLYALPSEIVGDQPDSTPEIQQTARFALKSAGVWESIVDTLLAHKLLTPADSDASDQLTLSL